MTSSRHTHISKDALLLANFNRLSLFSINDVKSQFVERYWATQSSQLGSSMDFIAPSKVGFHKTRTDFFITSSPGSASSRNVSNWLCVVVSKESGRSEACRTFRCAHVGSTNSSRIVYLWLGTSVARSAKRDSSICPWKSSWALLHTSLSPVEIICASTPCAVPHIYNISRRNSADAFHKNAFSRWFRRTRNTGRKEVDRSYLASIVRWRKHGRWQQSSTQELTTSFVSIDGSE